MTKVSVSALRRLQDDLLNKGPRNPHKIKMADQVGAAAEVLELLSAGARAVRYEDHTDVILAYDTLTHVIERITP